jgi:uncharacterized membrane protein SpoIIM required for sporulation
MVLEALFNPFELKKRPWEMFFAGGLYTIVGMFLALIVFKEQASIVSLFLIVLATVPVMYTTIVNEEKLDLEYDKEWPVLKEHTKVLLFLCFFFLGVAATMTLAYIFLPGSAVNTLFATQHISFGRATGQMITGNATLPEVFLRILVNNMRVLFFSIVLSFLYGVGSIFILTWNASIIAVATGYLFKTKLASAIAAMGFTSISAYFNAASFSFFRYMTHGLLEMAAYFVAGLAGGIISVALIKRNLGRDMVLSDSLILILISLIMVIVAGIIEVYITPGLVGYKLIK